MAEQLVFSILKDELIAKEGRYLCYIGGNGIYIKIGKLVSDITKS